MTSTTRDLQIHHRGLKVLGVGSNEALDELRRNPEGRRRTGSGPVKFQFQQDSRLEIKDILAHFMPLQQIKNL
jgi:hypothetical protein